MTTPFRRRPDDDDDDDERPDTLRRPSRPADDDDDLPASGQRAGSSGWVSPRFSADRSPARDTGSDDDFGFIKNRLDRRTSPPPKDENKEDEGSGLGGFLRRSKKPEDDQPAQPPSRAPLGDRPASPAGRFSPPGGSKPDQGKGGDEPHKSRLGGLLGRGSKDKDDKDDKASSPDRAASRRSPFLGGSGDSSASGGSSLRDSQRKPGTSPLGGSRDRQPIGADEGPRSGPSSPFNRDRTGSPDRSTSPFDRDRSSGGDRPASPFDRDRTGSPGGDRPTTGYDRPGGMSRPGISSDRTGSPLDRDRTGSPDRSTSPFDRDRSSGGDRPTSTFDRDRMGAGRPGAAPERTGSPFGDRTGGGRPDALRDRDAAGGAAPSGTRDFSRTGGDMPPRSASQTHAFPARPGAAADKDEPRKSRLGGLLGRGSKDKDKDQDKKGSKSAAASRPGALPGARASQTTGTLRSPAGGTTPDARGRGGPAPAAPDTKRRSQLTPAAKDTGRGLFGGRDKDQPGGKRGVPEQKSRATTPPLSSRSAAKPLPGTDKGAFTLEQGLDFERKIDLIGVALIGFALVTFFAVIPSMSLGLLPEPKQGLTGALNHLLGQLFGWGKIVWPIVAGGAGVWLMRESFAERGFELNFFRIVGMVMLYACALTWLQMFQLINDTAPSVEAFKPISYDLAIKQGQGGGWVGHTIYVFLLGQLWDLGTASVLLAWLIMSLMLTFDLSLVELWGYVAGVFAVFTITDEQRARKRAAREALAVEVMAAMRPGEAAATPGAAGEIATSPVRSTTRQVPAATTLESSAVRRGGEKRTAGTAEMAAPALAGRTPAAAGETPVLAGETTPDRSRPGLSDVVPSSTRPGPVINRRVGMPNGEITAEAPEADAKSGDDSSPLPARRRLPHFRGTTQETEAVPGAEPAAAAPAEPPKTEDAEAGHRRFGGLFGRGKDQTAEESASGSADKAAASTPTDPLARRPSFARPAPDDAAAEGVPGIPVPSRASAPAPDSAEKGEHKPFGLGRFRRGPASEDTASTPKPADTPAQEKEEDNGLSAFGRFRRKPDAASMATVETSPAPGSTPTRSEEESSGFGRFRRRPETAAPATTEMPAVPGDTPAKSEEGGGGLGRFRRGGSSATTESPAISPGEDETPAKSENVFSGLNRFRRKPDTDSPAASPGDPAGTKEVPGGEPSDQGDQRGRFGRFVPGLRRPAGSNSEPETKSAETPALSVEKIGGTPVPVESKTDSPAPARTSPLPADASRRERPSPFDSALRPSRTATTPDTPRPDREADSTSAVTRPEIPPVRRSPDLMNLASQAEPKPLSPLRRPSLDDAVDAIDRLKADLSGDDKEDDEKAESEPEEKRSGLGTLAALGAAGVIGAAALLDRKEDRREAPEVESNLSERTASRPVRVEPDTPEPVRSPFADLRRSESPTVRTPAFKLDDPLDDEPKPAFSDEKTLPADEKSVGEKPAQPARPDLFQRRSPFGDRPRSEPPAPVTPAPAPAEDAASTPTLPPARPVGLDPLRRSSPTPSSSEDAASAGAKPGEVGAAAPIQAPAMLRRSPLITPDSSPAKEEPATPPVKQEAPGDTVQSEPPAAPVDPPGAARPSPFADLPTRPAPAEFSGASEALDPPALPARPAGISPTRPAGISTPGASPTPPLARPVPRPASAVEIPTRPAPVEPDIDEDENEFDEEDFEEVDDENGNGSATPSVLGARSASPNNIPTGRPSLVQRGAALDHPRLPPKPAVPPTIVKREPAAAVAAGANAPESRSTVRGKGRYEPPDFRALLRRGDEKRINDEILLDKARVIEDTLVSFGAPGKVVEVNPGPVITQFGIEPDYVLGRQGKKMRVKVGAIARLDADLALALAAKSIRIEAPVPGKGFVGIEVPNDEVALVGLHDIMDSPEFRRIDSKLRLALGLGVDGSPVAADLTAMPHLLIAGTTGSGKSVCVNSIIACLLLENTPQDVQFIMVDPKRVELTGYNGIPHLVAPVVVDLERIVGVLQWVQREMEERYRKFAAITARNILDYNTKIGPDGQKMPYYVVVVDELADLMMLAPDETERLLARLAQMARATGIHLIISTQRPSVDIITGLIKANFPARIAFAVASSVDSRVILDQPGAEKLLGRGDMLYQSPDAAAPLRMQGAYVSDEEINRITSYWKSQVLQKAEASGARDVLASPSRDITLTRTALEDDDSPSRRRPAGPPAQRAFWDEDELGADATDGESKDDDELYQEAVDLVQRLGKASISLLQRRLRIGYTRSAKMIDMMEEDGIIGPAESGSKPREVLKLKPSARAQTGDDE